MQRHTCSLEGKSEVPKRVQHAVPLHFPGPSFTDFGLDLLTKLDTRYIIVAETRYRVSNYD